MLCLPSPRTGLGKWAERRGYVRAGATPYPAAGLGHTLTRPAEDVSLVRCVHLSLSISPSLSLCAYICVCACISPAPACSPFVAAWSHALVYPCCARYLKPLASLDGITDTAESKDKMHVELRTIDEGDEEEEEDGGGGFSEE